jgi:hypothetical protein
VVERQWWGGFLINADDAGRPPGRGRTAVARARGRGRSGFLQAGVVEREKLGKVLLWGHLNGWRRGRQIAGREVGYEFKNMQKQIWVDQSGRNAVYIKVLVKDGRNSITF